MGQAKYSAHPKDPSPHTQHDHFGKDCNRQLGGTPRYSYSYSEQFGIIGCRPSCAHEADG